MVSEVLKRPWVKYNVNHWASNRKVTKKNYQEASKTHTRNLGIKNSGGLESNSQSTLCWQKWNQSCMFLQILKRCAVWNLQDLTSHSGGKLRARLPSEYELDTIRQIKTASLLRTYVSAVRQVEITSASRHFSNEVGRCHFCQRNRSKSLLSEDISAVRQAGVSSLRGNFNTEAGRRHFYYKISVMRQAEVTSVSRHISNEAGRSHFCQ
jgi:hypothetical protein